MADYTGDEKVNLRQLNLYGSLIKKYHDSDGYATEIEFEIDSWETVSVLDDNYLGVDTYRCVFNLDKDKISIQKVLNSDGEEMLCNYTIKENMVTLYSDEAFSGKIICKN
jgi:hypothetical protein